MQQFLFIGSSETMKDQSIDDFESMRVRIKHNEQEQQQQYKKLK